MELSDEKWAEVMVDEASGTGQYFGAVKLQERGGVFKIDDFKRTLLANELFASKSDIPLHIGLTEAGGSFLSGTVKAPLRWAPFAKRNRRDDSRFFNRKTRACRIARAAYEILSAWTAHLRPNLISCPTCGDAEWT